MDGVVPGSPSSLSSLSSASDDVNTSSAKVFFGQFQSPEKKLAALISSRLEQDAPSVITPEPSSLRRSPMLSGAPALHNAEVSGREQSGQEEEEDDERQEDLPEDRGSEIRGGSWQDTPFLEFLRADEPSSAIASRIMRAHDNPSPPPKALRLSLSSRNSFPGNVFPLTPSSAESSDAAVESLLEPGNELRDSPTPPPIESELLPLPTSTNRRQSSPSSMLRGTPHVSLSPPNEGEMEPDLISFDRSILISGSPVRTDIHSPTSQRTQQLTIDDLLFFSPPQVPVPVQEQPVNEQEGSPTITGGDANPHQLVSGLSSNTEESVPVSEKPVNDEAQLEVEAAHVAPRTPDGKADRSELDTKIQTTPINHLPVPTSNSALRRSPRLSTLPPPLQRVVPHLSTPTRTPRVKTPKTDGSQSRKRRRKSPEKASRASLTPKRRDWILESDGSATETEFLQSPSKKGRQDRKRAKKDTGTPSDVVDSRLAESLSPGSTLILSNIVSFESQPPTPQAIENLLSLSTPHRQQSVTSTEDGDTKTPSRPSAPPPSSTIQRPPPGIFAPNIRTPARGNPAWPFLAPSSPGKVTLTPASRDDPNRTPARRVPIRGTDTTLHQPDGKRSTPTVMRPSIFSRPVFSRPVFSRPETSDRGQAKRILPSEPRIKVFTPPLENDTKPQSPKSISSGAVSAGPQQNVVHVEERKEVEEDDPSNKKPTDALHSSDSAAAESLADRVVPPSKVSPPSNASLPAPKAESRIPRPGTLIRGTATQKSKLPMPSARRPNGLAAPGPSRPVAFQKAPLSKVAQLHSNSSSSSDDSGASQTGSSGVEPPRKSLTNALAKRKRAGGMPAPPAQMTQVRRVIPGMYGGPVKTVALNGTEKAIQEQQPQAEPVQTVAQQRTLKPRRVTKGTLQNFELKGHLAKTLDALCEAQAAEEKARQEMQKDPSPPPPSLEAFTFECPVPDPVAEEQQEERMDVDSAADAPSESVPSSDDATDAEMASLPSHAPESGSSTRRSSRPRRPASTDVFGKPTTTATKPSTTTLPGQRPPVRRARGVPSKSRGPPNLLFTTNGLALKTLTNNNTQRNQNYHAQLEMHIVRKPGERPESPTMKLRTIVEKQKEDQDKMRAERARRRHGASDEGSNMDEWNESQSFKHRRGPGDEEDYETPVRPKDGRKAVKWDRGLGVSVFLDEIEVHPRKYRAKEDTSAPRKSCLIAAPNKPLDDLGNPLDINAPLGVVPEKVVVTKFVYDDDEEAALFDPPAPKMTRSKAKKK